MRFISSDGKEFSSEAKADAWDSRVITTKQSKVKKTPKEIKETTRKNRSYKNKHPYYKKFYTYKDRITRKNKSFDITFEEFSQLLEANCVYCGEEGGTIDRVKSNEGYTINNSVPCCATCNMMKHTLSKQSFINKIKAIYEHLAQ